MFDLLLGGMALLSPDTYLSLMHGPASDTLLLQRTGMIWLWFSAWEAVAFFRGHRWPLSILVVALLRLMDVPADLVYFFSSESLTTLGRLGLIASPFFNLSVGIVLIRSWRRQQ